MAETLTLVVHGTYAQAATWWRLGTAGDPTFADQLEEQLKRRDLAGSVWQPALNNGFDYDAFAWSGGNRHRERVKAGKKLGLNLNRLADRLAATPDQPLTVNFVAHSHGGNVVLEALRHLGPNVRTGRVAFLGTPWITVQPVLRPARFLLSSVWFWLFFLGLMMILLGLVQLVAGAFGSGPLVPGFEPFPMIGTALAIWLGYGWVIYLFGNLLDVVWRVVARVAQPLRWLQDKSWSRVYGPSDATLASRLNGSPILSLGTRNDEAELLLRVTSAPASLYLEYVRTRWPRWAHPLEMILLRPFVLGMVLSAVETFLEVATLGFSAWRALLFDFDIAPAVGQRPKKTPLFVHERAEVPPRLAAVHSPAALAETVPEPDAPYRLAPSVVEVAQEIRRQVQLRHTAYYDNEVLVDRVAQYLSSGELRAPATRPDAHPSRWATAGFWEALLAANAAMVALILWVCASGPAGPRFAFAGGAGLLAYLFPFAGLGLLSAGSSILRRRKLRYPSRWFWSWWALLAVLTLISAWAIRDLPRT